MAENDVQDNDYVSRTGQKDHMPVQDDNAPVEDPIDEAEADTDKALGTRIIHILSANPAGADRVIEKDDQDAIDKSNIVESRTRGAAKASGTYREPGDEEGIPDTDGTSSTA